MSGMGCFRLQNNEVLVRSLEGRKVLTRQVRTFSMRFKMAQFFLVNRASIMTGGM